jgi:3-oxoacyl-[acyl-carrier-protein] synthase II
MPFDLKRDGFIMGEGAGTVVLESKEHAIMRGAKILAKIDGYGMTTDPSHITSLDTGGEQIKNAISKAMGKVKDLSWINVHGTGTLINDLAEYNALKSYFKESLDDIYINSFKPYTGHLLGASSTVETAFCIMCMNERILPENLNLKEPTFNLKLKTDKRQGVKINNVLKLSHGFGGHIGALLISEAD